MFRSLVEADEIIVADSEFIPTPWNSLDPVCFCWKSLRTGRMGKVWLKEESNPPCPWVSEKTLMIAYVAEAELGTILEAGWELPEHVIDLFVEHKNLVNGKGIYGMSLLDACDHYKIPRMQETRKAFMRDLILRGGPWSNTEIGLILDYCCDDVSATESLFNAMLPLLSVPHCALRGRYIKAVARMERNGIPFDGSLQDAILNKREEILTKVIEHTNSRIPVYEGLVFKVNKFRDWIYKAGINWPITTTGSPRLDDDTLKEYSHLHPDLALLRDSRKFLSNMKKSGYPVDKHGYSKYRLRPFATDTGRNAPSTREFVFQGPAWHRVFIQPKPNMGLAYIDFCQQEFLLAGALSGDKTMLEDYASGDCYLAFAKRAGAVPATATKETHKEIRDQYKIACLAVNYGMTAGALAHQINQPVAVAAYLLRQYQNLYPQYAQYSIKIENNTLLGRPQKSVYGWQRAITSPYTKRGKSVINSIKNFPMQANGAEMMRMACIRATEAGIKVCCPVHDALLIEAPLEDLENAIRTTQACMKLASLDITDHAVRTDCKKVVYPDRFMEKRGVEVWNIVKKAIQK